jgi:hypothetical protein
MTEDERQTAMLNGAECMLRALYESATHPFGCSFGWTAHRFAELAKVDYQRFGVRCALHYAGGLTASNALNDDYRDKPKEGG